MVLHTPDRYLLEQVIIPHFTSRGDIQAVLFVGCDWYTNYYRYFFCDMEYWTIDCDIQKKKYASKNHVVDFLENSHLYFKPEYFDLIICNGVYGYGLDDIEQFNTAIRNCFDLLRVEGEFIFGWNDIPKRRPFPFEGSIKCVGFQRKLFVPFSTWRYLVKSRFRHTYDFYIKANPYKNR